MQHSWVWGGRDYGTLQMHNTYYTLITLSRAHYKILNLMKPWKDAALCYPEMKYSIILVSKPQISKNPRV